MKTAIIILSDPKGGEEALGRLFNALAVAHEGLQTGDQVEVVSFDWNCPKYITPR